jgi:NAD(P)-dependent dehydrogenase (short-subunit alcohol dehydrogenase family)
MSDKKAALISGGSRGIGLGIAHCLAADGLNLAINGIRSENAVLDILNELRGYDVKVIYCPGNIASAAEREKILACVRNQLGRLDVLVNNAGIAPKERRDILETTEQSFNHVLGTNLLGPYFLTQAVANWMISQKKEDKDFQGCIINISSISATVASTNRGEYCIAKAGLSMMTSLFAVRLGEFEIPVYEIRPGIIRTDMTTGVKEKYDKLIAEGLTVQNRWGIPEDIGKVVSALVRGSFTYSTGQVFMVDGGLTIPRL